MISAISVRSFHYTIFLLLLMLIAGSAQAEAEIPMDAKVKQEAAQVNSVRDYGRKMSKAEAATLEQILEKDPDDLSARAKLLGYYFYQGAKQEGAKATVKARRRHIIWLILNHPGSRLGGLPEAFIEPVGDSVADKVGYETASATWRAQAEDDNPARQTLENAFNFLLMHEKEAAERIAKKLNDPYRLGELYAMGMLRVNMMNQNGFVLSVGTTREDDRFAEHAIKALRASDDMREIDTAASILLYRGVMVQALCKRNGKDVEPSPIAFAGELLERCSECRSKKQYYHVMGMMSTKPAEKKKYAQLELALLEKESSKHAQAKSKQAKVWSLVELREQSEVAFNAGEYDKAAKYADELLSKLSADQLHSKRYGSHVHTAHIVLGRIALLKGDVKTAGRHLLDAGSVKGGATLSSFGPNMALAKELLEHGERDVVIAYLKRCKSFWDMDRGKLTEWIATIEEGGVPNFGANLVY